PLAVLDLGGGAVLSERARAALSEHAFAVLVEVSVEEAWQRAAGAGRPLARDAEAFRSLYVERQPVYEAVADGRARDADGVVLAAAGVHVAEGASAALAALVPGEGAVELVADETVARLHGARAREALGERLRAEHLVPAGERAKTAAVAEQLWEALRLDRTGMLVALGGGATTDLAGFVAATFLRGVSWMPVPSTLVGQVDAAIGGKTAIDLPTGKNLVGAFHWPARVVIDPDLLATLPGEERDNGLAEVVKTGLLAGERLWELPLAEQVRRCAAFKAAICLRDPKDRGERAQLNLGHTFAHALEAASGYALPHGRAVALGLQAALRLSGLPELAAEVGELLGTRPVRADRGAAWEALRRDKKAVGGEVRLVLLAAPGQPRVGVPVAEAEVRAALDALVD
ncbi:MAG: bifunctional shikimate kinase/3-dehydroquinate synthase, partial [Thermoleophilia bacterium]|nr:bifunctional shikimate kinase/3-dehydroquinate synthase [Thermoleophilia bacterium]